MAAYPMSCGAAIKTKDGKPVPEDRCRRVRPCSAPALIVLWSCYAYFYNRRNRTDRAARQIYNIYEEPTLTEAEWVFKNSEIEAPITCSGSVRRPPVRRSSIVELPDASLVITNRPKIVFQHPANGALFEYSGNYLTGVRDWDFQNGTRHPISNADCRGPEYRRRL